MLSKHSECIFKYKINNIVKNDFWSLNTRDAHFLNFALLKKSVSFAENKEDLCAISCLQSEIYYNFWWKYHFSIDSATA